VIGSVPFKTETLGKLLEQPVRFLALNPRSLSDIEADIRVVAGVVGRDSAATRVIVDMRREFARIRSKSQSKNRLRVYCEAWPNPRITSPPWVAELVDICGAKFVGTPGARISEEDVASANPDVIILAWAATGDRAKPERCYQVAAWKEVKAIKNHRVFVVKDELLNTPAPILTRGAQQLAKVISICGSQMLRRL
jgi:iron complex transport system substrate-binding protein